MVTVFQQNTLQYHQREERSWADPLLEWITKNPFSTAEKLITLAYALYLFSHYGMPSVIQTI